MQHTATHAELCLPVSSLAPDKHDHVSPLVTELVYNFSKKIKEKETNEGKIHFVLNLWYCYMTKIMCVVIHFIFLSRGNKDQRLHACIYKWIDVSQVALMVKLSGKPQNSQWTSQLT